MPPIKYDILRGVDIKVDDKENIINHERMVETALVKLQSLAKPPDISICSPNDARQLLYDQCEYDREHFRIIHLDPALKVIGIETLSIGTINFAPASTREAMKAALLNDTWGVICAHNHPSGDSTLSQQDKDIAYILQNAYKLAGIVLVDFMAISTNGYDSMREMGLLTCSKIKFLGRSYFTDPDNDGNFNSPCGVAFKAATECLTGYCGLERK